MTGVDGDPGAPTAESRAQPAPSPPRRRFVRRSRDRFIAGVCGGLGDYTGIAAGWWRLAFLVLAFIGGIGFVIYLLVWLVVPREDLTRSAAGRAADHFPGAPAWLGIALLMIAAVLLAGQLGVWTPSVRWALLLIGVGIILYVRDSERRGASPPRTPDRPDSSTRGEAWSAPGDSVQYVDRGEEERRASTEKTRSPLGWLAIGLALAVGGILWTLRGGGGPSTQDAFAYPLLIVGVGLVIGAFVGRAKWTILPGLLLIPIVLISGLITLPLSGNWANTHYRPTTATLLSSYHQAGGKLFLDLTRLSGGASPIDAQLAIGSIVVVIPSCAAFDIDANVGAGTLDAAGRAQSGLNVNKTIRVGTGSPIRMSLQVNIGTIEVDRESNAGGCTR